MLYTFLCECLFIINIHLGGCLFSFYLIGCCSFSDKTISKLAILLSIDYLCINFYVEWIKKVSNFYK